MRYHSSCLSQCPSKQHRSCSCLCPYPSFHILDESGHCKHSRPLNRCEKLKDHSSAVPFQVIHLQNKSLKTAKCPGGAGKSSNVLGSSSSFHLSQSCKAVPISCIYILHTGINIYIYICIYVHIISYILYIYTRHNVYVICYTATHIIWLYASICYVIFQNKGVQGAREPRSGNLNLHEPQ